MGWWLGFPGWIGKVLAMVGNSNCRMVSGSTYHPTGLPGRAFATYHDGMSKGAAPGVMGGLIQGWPAMAPACHRRRASLREFTCGDGRRRSVRIGLPLFAQESQRESPTDLNPVATVSGPSVSHALSSSNLSSSSTVRTMPHHIGEDGRLAARAPPIDVHQRAEVSVSMEEGHERDEGERD